MDICIDFDGTCVTHNFPKVGKDIGAVPVLQELVAKGHRLILFTMRSNRKTKGKTHHESIQDVTGDFLDDAIKWFEDNNIQLYGVQTNPTQKHWTTSPKAYGHIYIDDAALGIPLTYDERISDRPFVNWNGVRKLLINQKVL